MRTFISRNWTDIVQIFTAILLAGLGILLIGILHNQQTQASQRDKNVRLLLDNGAKQTLILCTVVVRNNANLPEADIQTIQRICQRQIKEGSDTTAVVPVETSIISATPVPTTPLASQPTNSSGNTNNSSSQGQGGEQPVAPAPSVLDQIQNAGNNLIKRLNPSN